MNKTSISWVKATDGSSGFTWSPVVGCSPISTGCQSCWASRLASTRLAHLPEYRGLACIDDSGERDVKPYWTGDVRFLADRLAEPLRRRKPSGIAVALMGDLFHQKVTNEQIAAVFGVAAACPQHTFYICTKRAKRRREWFDTMEMCAQKLERLFPHDSHEWRRVHLLRSAAMGNGGQRNTSFPGYDDMLKHGWPLPNVIQLTSVENQATLEERIEDTLATPAAVRGLSIEPLLGPVDFEHIKIQGGEMCILDGDWNDVPPAERPPGIDWVIVGGESGPRARPMQHEWAASIWRQCQDAGVPFHFKQEVVDGKLCHEPTLGGVMWRQMP